MSQSNPPQIKSTKSRALQRWLAAVIILLSCAVGLRLAAWLELGAGNEAAWAEFIARIPVYQYLAFPAVVFLLWIAPFKLPRVALLLASACALGGAVFLYRKPPDNSVSYIVTRLENDILESDTIKFRDSLRKIARRTGATVKVQRHHDTLESVDQAARILAGRNFTGGIVWGSQSWLNIATGFQSPLLVKEVANVSLPEVISNLKLARSISSFGLSFEPQEGSAVFINNFFAGALPRRTVADIQAGPLSQEREQFLLSAANIAAAWSSFAHRAVPWWELGNEYLFASVSGPEFQSGYLDCAFSAYRQGLGKLRGSDNLELQVAILNNSAIAAALKSYQLSPKLKLKDSRQLLRRAKSICKKQKQALRISEHAQKPGVARKDGELGSRECAAIVLSNWQSLSPQTNKQNKRATRGVKSGN